MLGVDVYTLVQMIDPLKLVGCGHVGFTRMLPNLVSVIDLTCLDEAITSVLGSLTWIFLF